MRHILFPGEVNIPFVALHLSTFPVRALKNGFGFTIADMVAFAWSERERA